MKKFANVMRHNQCGNFDNKIFSFLSVQGKRKPHKTSYR